MDALAASAESYADHDLRLRARLRNGEISDPERWLFQLLLDDPPEALAATPLLFDVGWAGGRFDLLFTDGTGTWCAVEVKHAPAIYGTSRQRKHRREKDRVRLRHLGEQAAHAWRIACELFPNDVVLGLALWRTDTWHTLAEHGPADRLAFHT